jgi:CHAD domain-containing protein
LKRWDLGGCDDVPIGEYRRAYHRGREAFHEASSDPSAEALHELRKRVKVLVYQLDVLDIGPAGPVARLLRLARLLAEELGEVHDLDVLREFLAAFDEARPILEPLDRRRLDLRRAALLRAEVVYRDRPRAFARMLEMAAGGIEVAPVEKSF